MIKGDICPCGSGTNFPFPEESITADLLAAGPSNNYPPKTNFPSYLRLALGWGNLHPTQAEGGAKISVIEDLPYRGGSLSHLKIGFSKPRVQTEALFAKHTKKSDTLILILHGHVSNMYKVLGLDVPDYMRVAGAYWFDRGTDVIAFNLTHKSVGSTRHNRLLLNYGSHLYGLQSRSICDVANVLELRKRYRNVYVYGLSSGGVIADLVSVVCKPFDLIVVGDIFQDWKKSQWGLRASHTGQEYSFYFNRPIFFESSYVDFIVPLIVRKFIQRCKISLSFNF